MCTARQTAGNTVLLSIDWLAGSLLLISIAVYDKQRFNLGFSVFANHVYHQFSVLIGSRNFRMLSAKEASET